MSFVLTWKTYMKSYIISVVIAFILKEQIQTMVILSTSKIINLIGVSSEFYLLLFIFIFITIIMIPIILLHECLHALIYLVLGGKVKIGFKGIYAYCQEISGIELTRTQFLTVLLAPVTVISIVSMVIIL